MLEAGLEYAEVELPQKSASGDSLARVLRADPTRFGLRLLNASALGGRSRTARDWALEEQLSRLPMPQCTRRTARPVSR